MTFETFYSDGGHSGPHGSKEAAIEYATAYIRGSEPTMWVAVVPTTVSLDFDRSKALNASHRKKLGVTLVKRAKKNPSRLESLGYQHMLRQKHGDGTRAYYVALKEALLAGEVSPGSIIGSGYRSPKKTALKWLDEKIASADAKKNPSGRWIQKVDKRIDKKGTEGAFTKQAKRAGYNDTMEYASKIMAAWRSGRKRVYNRKTKRDQKISLQLMRRANFALNVQSRRK